MARYKVLKRSFVNGQVHEVGAIVEYDGEVGSNLGPEDTVIEPTLGDINAFPPANLADLPKPTKKAETPKPTGEPTKTA